MSLLGNTEAPRFGLGANITFSNPSFSVPGAMPAAPQMPAFFQQTGFNSVSFPSTAASSAVLVPEYHPSNLGIATQLTGVVMKEAGIVVPPPVKIAGLVAKAAYQGYQLAQEVQRAEDAGQGTIQAMTCQTARLVADELVGGLSKAALVGGLVPFAAAAAAHPPLVVLAPPVAVTFSEAYKGAALAGHLVGEATASGCNAAFDAMRGAHASNH